ncbi:cytochrome c oxidase assembly protein [Nakamurella panacisegetis]|uniref:cytochrome c oxidase assembly protein n=1 Tax=Nakamurella panacisegetis TaxID=1090615 RepID=UPI0012FD6530|nr:cytochrome c oxidase assembly protein [Nakamurella panacisegetis]
MHSFASPTSAPSGGSLLTEWRPDYVMIVVVAILAIAYLRTRRRAATQGIAWARHRDIVFWVGVAATVWTTNGFPQARGFQLMWVWMTQELLLLLIVPIVIMSAQPVSLVTTVHGPDNLLARALRTRTLRFLGSPLVSPVLVPVLCMLLIFGGLGSFAVSSVWAGGVVHLLLLAVGALIALPLVNTDDQRSSLAVGLSLAVGFVELILDAFPGIALRFQTHMTLVHFAVNRPAFSPVAIDDQHVAGGILWVVAEVLDLPFLILAATRWIKADARDAARVDAELDARQHWDAAGEAVADPPVDRPWWLDDPALQDRFGGHKGVAPVRPPSDQPAD